ncbi:MAG: response regulator transcription factor [Clostridiales bacterium]|nr:response regulator transcription factor [Clostridiales bacterium]
MTDIKVLIADDDEGMRLVLRKLVSRVEGFTLCAEASNGREAVELAETIKPDVAFLDVEMPEMTGIECARSLQDMDPSMIVIFATAHDAYMGDAFEVYAFDYMVKPFKVERVIQTLERARQRIEQRKGRVSAPEVNRQERSVSGRLMLHHRNGVSFIDLKDILLVQREERSTVLYTTRDERYVTGDSLAEMEERLPKESFFRCHKSYIINLNHIKDITPYGRWTYVVRLEGTRHDALITHEKYDELEQMFR